MHDYEFIPCDNLATFRASLPIRTEPRPDTAARWATIHTLEDLVKS